MLQPTSPRPLPAPLECPRKWVIFVTQRSPFSKLFLFCEFSRNWIISRCRNYGNVCNYDVVKHIICDRPTVNTFARFRCTYLPYLVYMLIPCPVYVSICCSFLCQCPFCVHDQIYNVHVRDVRAYVHIVHFHAAHFMLFMFTLCIFILFMFTFMYMFVFLSHVRTHAYTHAHAHAHAHAYAHAHARAWTRARVRVRSRGFVGARARAHAHAHPHVILKPCHAMVISKSKFKFIFVSMFMHTFTLGLMYICFMSISACTWWSYLTCPC